MSGPDFHEREGKRTILDMIAGRNAPLHAGRRDKGKRLRDAGQRECRFPLAGQGDQMWFCAAEVEEDVWLPGLSGRCYCALHRAVASRPRGAKAVA